MAASGTYNLYNRWLRVNNGINPNNVADSADLVDTNQAGTQLQTAGFTLGLTGSTGAALANPKVVGGSGALVTGTLTIATGLTTIYAFTVEGIGQPTGTGTASAQLFGIAVTTGSVVVSAYSVNSITGGTVAATTSTGSFSWLAYGA